MLHYLEDSKKEFPVVIATHAVFLQNKDIYGPPHAISVFLNKNKINHVFIKHRLDGLGLSTVEYYKEGRLNSEKKEGFYIPYISGFRYLSEFFINIRMGILLHPYLFIGVDPLNSLAANILKFLQVARKTVYLSADFAATRFRNVFFNNIYLFLDMIGMKRSDQTWSVSERIRKYRMHKGLPASKNLLLPNAPFFADIKRKKSGDINYHDIVIVSAIEKDINFLMLIDVIKKIKEDIEDIKLIIIGSGSEEKKVKDYVENKKLISNVVFLGALSHEDMFTILVKCGMGVALYQKYPAHSFRYFSDPMKVRDYLASGLPVIISGNSSLAEEVEKRKAGFLIDLDEKDLYEKLLSLLKNKKNYEQMREQAILLAKEYDTYALLEQYLKGLTE